jgi:Mce-associated membrane protein
MRRLLRLYRPFSVALAIVLLALALRPASGMVRDDGDPRDKAVLDDVATTEVIGDVSTALGKVFTYKPDDVATTGQVAARELSGTALAQYRRIFGQVERQAPAQRATLTTRVVRAGVVALTGDTARLLVFLDQTATRAGKPAGTPAAAQLLVTAHRDHGHWSITDLKSA